MKILVIGKSAREQAFIEKIATCKRVNEIFCTPGNPAIASYATCFHIAMDDITSMLEFAKETQIDLTIVFDEELIEKGISNIFKNEGLRIFAPTKEAAQIGTNRSFAKKFLYRQKAPITKYGVFDKENSAIDFLKKSEFPVMIKYDYNTDNDSFLCKTFAQAKNILDEIFSDTSKRIIIEEYPDCEEFNITVLTDGYQVLPLPYVKIIDEKDKKGNILKKALCAYTPVAQITEKTESDIAQKIIFPVIDALQNSKTPYEGFLSLKFALQKDGKITAIEFSPSISVAEAVCLFPLIEDDLLDIIYIATENALEDCYQDICFSDDAIFAQVLLNLNKQTIVQGIENLDDDDIDIYYNDVGINANYEITTNGTKAFWMRAKASTLNKASEILKENIGIVKM